VDEVVTTPIEPYLRVLAERGGSDLLLVAGATPMLRVDGGLVACSDEVLTPERTAELVRQMLPPAMVERLHAQRELDFSFGWGHDARIRAHCFHQRGSLALALRLIPREAPTLDELGLPPALGQLGEARQGLVLVTGPTGSGKSSTLAALVRHAGSLRACHVVTIEDPIEYFHSHGASIVTQREVGTDTDSFPRALRAALREDPDIVLVGEMRDLESIEATITVAETGHLVLATLHANDASQAIDRVIDVFPPDRQAQIRTQLAATLLGVVAQRLLPAVGGGRAPVIEILLANPAVRNLIRDGKTEQLRNLMTTGQRAGMQTFDADMDRLVAAGVIDRATADAARLST
jgi:twitching motility protein PilT